MGTGFIEVKLTVAVLIVLDSRLLGHNSGFIVLNSRFLSLLFWLHVPAVTVLNSRF